MRLCENCFDTQHFFAYTYFLRQKSGNSQAVILAFYEAKFIELKIREQTFKIHVVLV